MLGDLLSTDPELVLATTTGLAILNSGCDLFSTRDAVELVLLAECAQFKKILLTEAKNMTQMTKGEKVLFDIVSLFSAALHGRGFDRLYAKITNVARWAFEHSFSLRFRHVVSSGMRSLIRFISAKMTRAMRR
jgi:hypothetical protein